MIRPTWVRVLPWTLLAVSIALKVLAVALVLATPIAERSSEGLGFLVWAPGVLAFAVVGTVVAWRRPETPVGWLFLAVGFTEPVAMFAESYARLAASSYGFLPGAGQVGSVGAAVSTTPVAFVIFVILLFPTGGLPSRRWLPMLWLVTGWAGLLAVSTVLAPGRISDTLMLVNPFSAPGSVGQAAALVTSLEELSSIPLILLAAAALITRWRRAVGVERAQMKWFVSSIALLVLVMVMIVPFWELLKPLPPEADTLFSGVTVLAIAAVPFSAGIAILRHRLFDIDLVIRRTLVYAALVVILGAVYVGLMLSLQALLTDVTGGQTLPVALSTLAIAALFGPVRGHVRELVDRRFYRSRYDAQRTLEQFAGRLRDEVAIEQVGRTLVATAGQAVRPTSASMWIRGGAPR